ncbi:MAG: VOC family protein [Elusimicrobiota bacterium]
MSSAQSFIYKGGKIIDKVVHFELPVDDIKRARKFYSQIFGWEIEKMPGSDMEYYPVRTVAVNKKFVPKEPGAINGGMMKRNSPGETPVIVINVPDLDKYLTNIEKAGGKIEVPQKQVLGMGLYSRVKDSEGNVIGIWQNLKR